MLEEGQVVTLKTPVIIGPILDIQYNKSKKCLEYLVQWTNEAGAIHSRWFVEDALKVVEED